ncbi:MAG: SDR family NAD(P)-dependent oxidoreductase [Roseiarcus sp.]|jgi:NAD(P)-dependent dehydrogenase (short-subunit alcohol dehydrogenase family)
MHLDSTIAAIVTGGASGLGEATARKLAAAGARVAIFDVQAERGAAVAGAIGGLFCKADVTDEASLDAALAAARAAHGVERVLVCCAGIGPARRTVSKKRDTGELVAHDVAMFRRTIEINLIGTFALLARSAAAMAALEPISADGARGVIVTTASVAAQDGQIGQAAYAASKGGVLALTLPVARDLAASGIRVNTILPGLFHTPMFDGIPEEARSALAASVPFPSRLGRPDEYADLVAAIIGNDMINGTAIRLDGALRMAPK